MNIVDEKTKVDLLTDELVKASEAYYNGKTPIMSDIEFDRKLEELKNFEEETGYSLPYSPTKKVGAKVVTELKKVIHEFPALSLDKVKYAEREKLVGWLGKYRKEVLNDPSLKTLDGYAPEGILSWKNDGLTVILTYDNGKLVQAATRGNDGIEGSDITHNAIFFKGVPKNINYQGHLVVRGEAVMTFEEFDRINLETDGEYENPRNLASATIQMYDASESRKREIQFKAFELVVPEVDGSITAEINEKSGYNLSWQCDRFKFLKSLGFDVVEFEEVTAGNILEKIEEWQGKIKKLGYPTDGLVISYNNMRYGMSLGNTGHHFRHSIALKWTDETKTTTIRDIFWSVGKTGTITPVAIFDKVRLGAGSDVTKASLHNLSIMRKLNIRIGCKAEVYLANQIIPAIASTDRDETLIYPEYPKTCPVCGRSTEIEENNGTRKLKCVNSACPARQMGGLMNTFSKDGLFVKGLGESQIQDILDYGLAEKTADFYSLRRRCAVGGNEQHHLAHMLSKKGWGSKKWTNLLDAIDASRETTLQKFLYSLNIPLLGNDLSKKLSKYWNGDVDRFITFIEQSDTIPGYLREKIVDELTAMSGIGEEKATNIANWAAEMIETGRWTDEIVPLINELEFPEVTEVSGDNSLEGLTFVITGAVHVYKNRDEFKASVEARGGKVAGSVSAKTSFLVANDKDSGTGKAAKAAALGVPVLTENEFIEKFGR